MNVFCLISFSKRKIYCEINIICFYKHAHAYIALDNFSNLFDFCREHYYIVNTEIVWFLRRISSADKQQLLCNSYCSILF